jgi:hypothetical protein
MFSVQILFLRLHVIFWLKEDVGFYKASNEPAIVYRMNAYFSP